MVMVFNVTIFEVYRGGQFYLWNLPRKNHRPAQITDKLYHIKLCRVYLVISGIRSITLVVIGTDLHNYHKFTITTHPPYDWEISYKFI